MEPISRKELEQQAEAFAEARIAFLEEQNSQSKHTPRAKPKELKGMLMLLYQRFVARHREVTP